MNWRKGKPPDDFAGFAIEYREPGGDRFFTLKNRLSFIDHEPCANELSTWLSPIQKFRWEHLPRHAGLKGVFTYRVTPVFMNNADELSYGEPQEADIILSRETYAEEFNVAFTRGFVSSQAFVDRYRGEKEISRLLPPGSLPGTLLYPSHPKAAEALSWMGFEARQAILDLLDAKVCFSPHSGRNAVLGEIAGDIARKTTSTLLYSLAFLYQTEGSVRDAIERLTDNSNLFIYGISDKKVGGLELRKPNGNLATVFPSVLSANLPEPFSMEPIGGKGNRMHHKFIVVDFDKPTARVYTGSFNFSAAADLHNRENLLLIKNRRVAVSYMIEALRLFDHYHFRVTQRETRKTKTRLCLSKPPRTPDEKPWWYPYYTDPVKIIDRELFGNFEKA